MVECNTEDVSSSGTDTIGEDCFKTFRLGGQSAHLAETMWNVSNTSLPLPRTLV